MSKAKTRWFGGQQKPWEPGLYERQWGGGNVNRDYWDGRSWSMPFGDGDHAWCSQQSLPWRGLREKE